MSDEVLIAVIGGSVSVLLAVAAAWRIAISKTNETNIAIARIEVKLDTLWRIYAEDAIRQARTAGMVASKSPESPTREWEEMIPDTLLESIHLYLSTVRSQHSQMEAAILIFNQFEDQLIDIARLNHISPPVIFGVIYIISGKRK
jgi:hypothetical protein